MARPLGLVLVLALIAANYLPEPYAPAAAEITTPCSQLSVLTVGRLAVAVALLPPVSAAADNDGYAHCEGAVRGWADSAGEGDDGADKLNLKDLLFFLHIPRTGGRAYFHCFLKKLYTTAQECPRSYDKLRFDPSHPDCKLVVSHDDYSLTSKLPKERTSVVTILRNPVDRVFSTYEFSVEVAARFLVHPNLTSAKSMTTRLLKKTRGVSTLDIWPWKYLVPWMREDLFARRDARGIDNTRSSNKVNPYDVDDMAMPLHQYINDPVAHEIIHNGATFQVTGLTNNSYFDGAHKVRHCVRKHPDLGRFVLQVAKNRLDRMLYVGLTEDHEESARLFAHMVGAQVLSQSGILNLDIQEDPPSGTDPHSSMLDQEDEETNEHMNSTDGWSSNDALNTTDDDHGKGNMTVGKLMETYESCIASLRKSQSNRRKISLKKVAEANFTKAARRQVPEAILKQIISLNSLDMELYEHAKSIFTQEHLMLKGQQSGDQKVTQEHLMLKGQHPVVVQDKQSAAQKDWIDTVCDSWNCSTWKVVALGLGISVTTVFIVFAVTSRRTLKLKI
ncbi:protein-tyrosine sulfotransferase-like [Lolium rigidum]|uniref:protein-tyrosine sulfotransferase-like n=1 Tax=Lolium rigidum TaxID=89674 RepID=UPI001F5DAA30|nr:protein-tyrosine sulfotransferase-like [Lolium rigidum]